MPCSTSRSSDCRKSTKEAYKSNENEEETHKSNETEEEENKSSETEEEENKSDEYDSEYKEEGNENKDNSIDHKKIDSHDSTIMILLEKMSAIERELQQLRSQSNNTTNNITNNLIINVVFQAKNSQGSENAIDIFECLKLKGWNTSQIYAYAVSLVNQPKDKLRWTLNELIIDLAKMKYTFFKSILIG